MPDPSPDRLNALSLNLLPHHCIVASALKTGTGSGDVTLLYQRLAVSSSKNIVVQLFDLTTAIAALHDLRDQCLPARVEIVQQTDLWTIHLGLRTARGRRWTTLSWHPQAARFHLGSPIPKGIPDPFQFSQIMQRLQGLALVDVVQLDPWERVTDWQLARRPGDEVQFHLYLETMGKHSNVALVGTDEKIIACGRGVSDRQSSVRPLQPGLTYQAPPALLGVIPSAEEPFADWQERLSWPPQPLRKQVFRTYRGLSRSVVEFFCQQAGIDPQTSTDAISSVEWQALFDSWQRWLELLTDRSFTAGWKAEPEVGESPGAELGFIDQGYTLFPEWITNPADSIHQVLEKYYDRQLERQQFDRDRHRLTQKLQTVLKKLTQRRQHFDTALEQSDRADEAKQLADLLMAHMYDWKPGMTEMVLPDFETGEDVKIALNPEKNAVANAQQYYKQHGKQKRARDAVTPLLQSVTAEIDYLEQVLEAIAQLGEYHTSDDLQTLQEIERELIDQAYLADPDRVTISKKTSESEPHQFSSPNGFDILIGRNNRQNDIITFKLAQNTDWWFHAQEIPGSHVLLRLPPGAVAEDEDLQAAADYAAYFSRGRLSDRVPTLYTRPKHVYKLKGAEAKPGMVTYLQQTVLWGDPHRAAQVIGTEG